ncbi:MAG TPA: hypothetical protein ENJ37_10305 [Deltaproteobacteria bacterium]|nr:hypothetical protein [Deltaproteobacteria bacterium]
MSIWTYAEGFSPGEKWGEPDRMNGLLLLLLAALRREFRAVDASARFIVHAGFATSGHAPRSQHYSGNAADFHVETTLSYGDQVALMVDALDGLQVTDRVGLGIYPHWNSPGFHLDVRGEKRRWGRLGGGYVSFEEAMEAMEEGEDDHTHNR